MKLTPFEGKEVWTAGIEIPRAGGGLHEALQIEPIEKHHGERVTVVMELSVNRVRYDEIKDTDALSRVHVMGVEEATIVEPAVVKEIFAAHRQRVEQLRREEEEREGIRRLPGLEGGEPRDKDEAAADA